jgi:hypothetical protein
MMSKSLLKAAGGSITTCQRSSRERLGMVAGVDSDKNGWSCCFRGRDSAIDVATPNPKFDAWRWVQPPELSTLAVSFKRRLYLSVLAEFPTIFRD